MQNTETDFDNLINNSNVKIDKLDEKEKMSQNRNRIVV